MRHIYTFKNLIDGKIYVGQTKHPGKRKREHLGCAKDGSEGKLYAAIRKYGEENFLFEVVENCEDEVVNEREVYWVQYFDSFKCGYNMTSGGDHFDHSEETKEKIGNHFRGKHLSEEHKQRLREANLGKKPPPHTPEVLQRMSESMKGKNTGPKSAEHRAKLAEARRKWKLTDEQKERIKADKKPVSEETRKKLSEAGKGRVHSEETKKKMSDAQKGIPRPSPSPESIEKRAEKNRGKKRTEEQKQRMREGKARARAEREKLASQEE